KMNLFSPTKGSHTCREYDVYDLAESSPYSKSKRSSLRFSPPDMKGGSVHNRRDNPSENLFLIGVTSNDLFCWIIFLYAFTTQGTNLHGKIFLPGNFDPELVSLCDDANTISSSDLNSR